MSRAAARLVVMVLLLLVWPLSLWAAPSAGSDELVREGHTELAPSKDLANAASEAGAPPPVVNELPSSVADAPQAGKGVLRMPPLPAGFNSYDAGWVRFVYHPSSRERVQPLIAQAEAVRHELVERLGFPVLSEVRVLIARTPGEMATFAPSGAPYPEYAAGVAYSELGLVLLSLAPVHAGDEQDLAEVFRHELAHVALHDAVNGTARTALVQRRIRHVRLRRILVQAHADAGHVYHRRLADSAARLGALVSERRNEGQWSPTRRPKTCCVSWSVVKTRIGFEPWSTELREGKSLERAVLDAYGVELSTLEFEWREDAARRYTIWIFLLSGSFVWVIALGVFVWAWRRRRRRDQLVLQRWAREEAAEDVQRARLALRDEAARVHIVLAKAAEPALAHVPAPLPEEIPVVEHDGSWHTLH